MARWTRDHMLEIGAAILVVGLVLAGLSYTYNFADAPAALNWYGSMLEVVPGAEPKGTNLWVMILGTVALIAGAFYFGEQVVLRRRFERLLSTAKKSDFASNRRQLDALAPRLPSVYRKRIKEKEAELRSTR